MIRTLWFLDLGKRFLVLEASWELSTLISESRIWLQKDLDAGYGYNDEYFGEYAQQKAM